MQYNLRLNSATGIQRPTG